MVVFLLELLSTNSFGLFTTFILEGMLPSSVVVNSSRMFQLCNIVFLNCAIQRLMPLFFASINKRKGNALKTMSLCLQTSILQIHLQIILLQFANMRDCTCKAGK